jgi:DNA repair protein RadC
MRSGCPPGLKHCTIYPGHTSILLCHNHPSGSLKPAQNDIELTQRIKEAAKYMDIYVQDHIIVTFELGKYFSFADEGLL